MQFSIVIPTYNYANYLKHNLDSLFRQNFQDFEIVLVDDGSTDHTQAVVTDYVNLHPQKIRYFYQQNAGPAVARNRGLREAVGDYIIFLDSDDVLTNDALAIFANAIQNNEVDLIIGRHATIAANGHVKESMLNQISANCEHNFLSYIRKKISLTSGSYAVRKSALKEIIFPENLKGREDILFFALMLANLSCVSISDIVMRMNKHQDSLRHKLPDIDKTKMLPSMLFEHIAMPVSLKKYRNEFESRLYLSLFRQFYKAHEYKKARNFYWKAIKLSPKNIFAWAYLQRFLMSLFV